jgi:hypothetical protein
MADFHFLRWRGIRSCGGITRDDLQPTKVFHHRAICDGFLIEYSYEIIVGDSGYQAFPVERGQLVVGP